TLDGGGGPGADDFFAVHATLGQPDAGILGDDFFALEGGFWVAALAAGPSLTRQPESVTVSRGDPVTFNIVASGNLPLRYQWRLNGVNLAGATNATLAIPGAQLTNGGTYTVVVFNDRGSVVSQPA